MFINRLMRYFDPADKGGGGGGDEDRGDNWTDEQKAASDAEEAAAAETARLAKLAEDNKDVEKTDEEKAAEAKVAEEAKAAEDAAQAAEEEKKKDTRVPLSRHKQILDGEKAKREAVELELSKYKQAERISDVNKDIGETEKTLLKLEADYAQAVVDGHAKDAAGIMAEIRKTERAIVEKTSDMRVAAAEARAVESARYETTVDRIEGLFPALNVDHADFDKAKAAEVVEMKEAFQAKGYTPSAALQKAVKYVMPPQTAAQESVLKVEPKVDAAAVEKARKAAAVAKALEASDKQPADTKKVGLDSDKKGGGAISPAEAIKMPYDKFKELNEDTLAALRGDVV